MLGPYDIGTAEPVQWTTANASGALFDPPDVYFSFKGPNDSSPTIWHWNSTSGDVVGSIVHVSTGTFQATPPYASEPPTTPENNAYWDVEFWCTGSIELAMKDFVKIVGSDLWTASP